MAKDSETDGDGMLDDGNENGDGTARYLPHAAPMVMIRDVEFPADRTAAATADVSPRNVFFDAAAGGVPGCAALEFMAQTMAAAVGRDRASRGLPPKVGFVLGSRKLKIGLDVFNPEKTYRAVAACVFSDDEFASFDCRIEDSRGRTVASGALTAYQPSDGDALDVVRRD